MWRTLERQSIQNLQAPQKAATQLSEKPITAGRSFSHTFNIPDNSILPHPQPSRAQQELTPSSPAAGSGMNGVRNERNEWSCRRSGAAPCSIAVGLFAPRLLCLQVLAAEKKRSNRRNPNAAQSRNAGNAEAKKPHENTNVANAEAQKQREKRNAETVKTQKPDESRNAAPAKRRRETSVRTTKARTTTHKNDTVPTTQMQRQNA